MCLSCGCHLPTNTHADPRHIVLADLVDAAAAAGISPAEAANNISDTVADMIVGTPSDS